MLNRRSTALSLLALGFCALGLGACSYGAKDYSTKTDAEIRDNPTPELAALNRRQVDRDDDMATATDTNLRAANDDWDTFWLIDRPSRLNDFPHPR